MNIDSIENMYYPFIRNEYNKYSNLINGGMNMKSKLNLDLFKFDLARAKKCYNKKQVAKKAGLSYDNLMKILSGRISLTATSLGKIAKALDVEPIELIQDEA